MSIASLHDPIQLIAAAGMDARQKGAPRTSIVAFACSQAVGQKLSVRLQPRYRRRWRGYATRAE